MKTLQKLYTEILGSDEMKKSFAEAARDGKISEFLKAQGCEATMEEIQAFLKEKAGKQLSDEELDNAAGGTCNKETAAEAYASTFTAGIWCATFAIASTVAGYTGQKKDDEGRLCNYG